MFQKCEAVLPAWVEMGLHFTTNFFFLQWLLDFLWLRLPWLAIRRVRGAKSTFTSPVLRARLHLASRAADVCEMRPTHGSYIPQWLIALSF